MPDDVINQPTQPSPKTNIFLGKHGLRSGWRLLIYIALVAGLSALINTIIRVVFHPRPGVINGWTILGQELLAFSLVFGVALLMSRIEHRPAGAYGLPGSALFGGNFWLGFLFGFVEISLLIGLISAFGGYKFGSLALQGGEIVKMGLLYLAGFTSVGLFEEFAFRGYTQFTLADGIGFWPAAIILSVLFGAGHLANPGEGPVGAASVVLIALLFCFSLKRSGSLWYAVGLHAAFDWGESYVYSVPDSGLLVPGHLSNAVLQAGPKWLTGGSIGPEGSVFCFLTILLQFLVVLWLFPAKKDQPVPQTVQPSSPPLAAPDC
jgi:uncharacterized protein